MKTIEAYQKLASERFRVDPRIIVAHEGSQDMDCCKKLVEKGFAVLKRVSKHPKEILNYRVYEITHTETQIETADYRLR